MELLIALDSRHREAVLGEVLQAIHPRQRGRVLWQAGFSVCAPTLPGHGRGGDPARARLDDLLACVADSGFIDGGHRLMLGRAAARVAGALAGTR